MAEELRYEFGRNWAEFLEKNFNPKIVDDSKAVLANFVRLPSLKGQSFLDIGCGSGLHSLAAHRMEADQIFSFDYDADSVATTERIRHHAGDPTNWAVAKGSVLDENFVNTLPKFDIVYSWGVLHHTGDMWKAVRNAAIPTKPDGLLYIALYSSDNYVEPPPQYWIKIKRRYNRSGPIGRRMMEWWYVWRFHIRPALNEGKNPIETIRKYGYRGMTFWTDARDWLGGYPIEFAGLHETESFCKTELGLDLVNVKSDEGCAEYLFCDLNQNAQWRSITERRRLIHLPGPFASQGGFSFSFPVPHLEEQADCSEFQRRSRLMVYEDGRLLGLAHSLHDRIVRYGKGRFSHWGTHLLFSTTDNSDPNTNGRGYAYCEEF